MSWVPILTWIIDILTEISQDFLQNIETYLMQCHILESSKLMAVSDSFNPFYKLHATKSQNLPNNLYSSISSLCHNMPGWKKKLHHTCLNEMHCARFQASTAVQMKSLLFWVVMQHMPAVVCVFQDSLLVPPPRVKQPKNMDW